MDVSLLKLLGLFCSESLNVVRPARVATLAGSDRSHRFQGRDPEETLPQAGVEMVRLVTAGGDAKPGTVAVVVKKGYLMHDRAVRAAEVGVVKGE